MEYSAQMLLNDDSVRDQMKEAGLPEKKELIDKLDNGISLLAPILMENEKQFKNDLGIYDEYSKNLKDYSDMVIGRAKLQFEHRSKVDEILAKRRSEMKQPNNNLRQLV